jgi:hypothetical protein
MFKTVKGAVNINTDGYLMFKTVREAVKIFALTKTYS